MKKKTMRKGIRYPIRFTTLSYCLEHKTGTLSDLVAHLKEKHTDYTPHGIEDALRAAQEIEDIAVYDDCLAEEKRWRLTSLSKKNYLPLCEPTAFRNMLTLVRDRLKTWECRDVPMDSVVPLKFDIYRYAAKNHCGLLDDFVSAITKEHPDVSRDEVLRWIERLRDMKDIRAEGQHLEQGVPKRTWRCLPKGEATYQSLCKRSSWGYAVGVCTLMLYIFNIKKMPSYSHREPSQYSHKTP